jgi:hypothetical protein
MTLPMSGRMRLLVAVICLRQPPAGTPNSTKLLKVRWIFLSKRLPYIPRTGLNSAAAFG